MKLTKRGDICQHCGLRPAAVTLTWNWEDGDSDEEDWCADCVKNAHWPDKQVPIDSGSVPRG